MIQPKSTSEYLMYSTVRLVASDQSTGTGFFFNFTIGSKLAPVIITNKHVVKNNQQEKVTFFLHTKKNNGPDDEKLNITFQPYWYFHTGRSFALDNFEKSELQVLKKLVANQSKNKEILSKELITKIQQLDQVNLKYKKMLFNYEEAEAICSFLKNNDSERLSNKLILGKDLCFCFVQPLFEEIRNKYQKDIFYAPITEDLIWNKEKLESLSAIENVIMVGYPNGLWNELHNLPLFRQGITSSHPAVDFNVENIGAVDMACFPGSSGSPIFILNEMGYLDKNSRNYTMGGRMIFLGILFSGPQSFVEGKLIQKTTLAQQEIVSHTPSMINLGYYIKAEEILSFKPIIEELCKGQV